MQKQKNEHLQKIKMSQIEFFLFILLLEIIVLTLMFISLVIERVTIYVYSRNRKRKMNLITSFIKHSLENNIEVMKPLPRALQHPAFLIEVMCSSDLRFQGKIWEDFKKNLTEKYILKKLRKWTKSFFWRRRLIAAKGMSLYCHAKDAPLIHLLIDDPFFLTQSAAYLAALRSRDAAGIEKMLKKLGNSSSFIRSLIKASLMKEPKSSFSFIDKILKETSSESVLIAGFDILSTQKMQVQAALLKKSIQSQNVHLRLAAITLHAHNPQDDSDVALEKALNDADKRIRKEACFGLRNFPSKKNVQKLSAALEDEDFLVRLAAAQSLEEMGKEGKDILKKMINTKSGHSHKIATYILNLKS